MTPWSYTLSFLIMQNITNYITVSYYSTLLLKLLIIWSSNHHLCTCYLTIYDYLLLCYPLACLPHPLYLRSIIYSILCILLFSSPSSHTLPMYNNEWCYISTTLYAFVMLEGTVQLVNHLLPATINVSEDTEPWIPTVQYLVT